MKKFYYQLIFILLIFSYNIHSQELRATWIARDNLTSKLELAKAMDSLAANNFNVVYVNVWSRGYPLWKSNVFYNETGKYIDPTYEGRDILAEAIAEGHKNGLHVEAWFEYGFVGGWTGNLPPGKKGPIFDTHPDWVAKQINGTEIDNSNFYWMVQTRLDVQNFLIALCTEIARNYDVDGIELDRIRYSSLNYGYDSYTDSLYRSENNGAPPPINVSDPSWIRWRADKLNEFIARCYDSLKFINPKLNISNAPSLYSSSGYTSYTSFCQDWVWWVNNNKVDNVQVQSYVTSPNSFGNILDYLKTMVNNHTKVFPAFAISPSGNPLPEQTLYEFIDLTRAKGFKGNSIWYYKDMLGLLNKFKINRYNTKTYPHFSEANWREYYKIVKISDTLNAKRSGLWNISFLAGLENQSLYAVDTPFSRIDYYFDVPVSGIYELYAFQVIATDRTLNAPYTAIDSNNTLFNTKVNQSIAGNGRWFKIADLPLRKGYSKVLTLTNQNIGLNSKVSADAAMIILNRRLSPNLPSSVKDSDVKNKDESFNLINYPNPFNNNTKILFNLTSGLGIKIRIFNSLGETLKLYEIDNPKIGLNELTIDTSNFSSGVYFCQLIQNDLTKTHKLLYIK